MSFQDQNKPYRLMIITASTREGRKGPAIADWITAEAAQTGKWTIDSVDLRDLALPMLDEAEHPAIRAYKQDHTKVWSAMVDQADAFIFVTPEYNFSFPASLKNAIDYLFHEWAYKPLGFVSYGGIAAGTRAVQMLKQVVTTLKIMPVPEAVNVPFFWQNLTAEGAFAPDAATTSMAADMLSELHRWTAPLHAMRMSKTLTA
jgi:NAD(P)H-dependent FMN reductase